MVGICFLPPILPFLSQDLSGGHALWYAGMMTLYYNSYVGVFNINPKVSLSWIRLFLVGIMLQLRPERVLIEEFI